MQKPQVFVIRPFGRGSEGVYGLIASAVEKANASVFRVDATPPAVDFVDYIQQAIRSANLVIADITDGNSNVMFEIGLARAEDKPLILVADSSISIPFDLAGGQILVYDLGAPLEFVERLTRVILRGLAEPESLTPSKNAAERDRRQKVFISYSHLDREYLDRLLVHLKPLENEGLIDLWADTKLRPGDRWKKEIEKALNQATVAILLVSADFLASSFITDNELPPILRNAEEKGTKIIPLILKPCRFARDKNLRHFQAINDPTESLILVSPGEQEMYYDSVAREVENTFQRM